VKGKEISRENLRERDRDYKKEITYRKGMVQES
jgi:hypothetical protein